MPWAGTYGMSPQTRASKAQRWVLDANHHHLSPSQATVHESSCVFPPPSQIEIIASAITYNLSLATTKASILFFYLRFPSSRLFRAACYLVLFVAAGNGLTAGFAFLYLCQPIERHWNRKIEGHCGNPAVPFWVAAIVNMCTDAIILFLPVWLLRPLRLGPAKTASVLCVLMAGGLYVPTRSPGCIWTD